jgi:hypothetical protein
MVAQVHGASGQRVGGEFQVNTYTTGWQLRTAVASDPEGNFVVVWETAYFPSDVSARRFDASGNAIGGEFQVATHTAFDWRPRVAMDSAGEFFARRYDSAGNALGLEFVVNASTTGFQAQADLGSLA